MSVLECNYDEKMDSYTFINEGVEYIAGYNEDKPLSEGGFEHHEFLMVRKDCNVLLKEERISNTD